MNTQDAVDRANLLADRVNQAIRFAQEVSDPQIRAVRATAAARVLAELQDHVASHSFLRIERLDSVEAKLAELLGAAGGHAPAAHSGDPLGTARANSDLIKGLEFRATLQLRTPLAVLQKHGAVHRDLTRKPPAYAKAAWQGIWSPILKSWKELGGADIPEWSPSEVATDLGPMKDRGDHYYRFLLAIRTAAANEMTSLEAQRAAVIAEAGRPEWSAFTEAHGGASAVASAVAGIKRKARARRASG